MAARLAAANLAFAQDSPRRVRPALPLSAAVSSPSRDALRFCAVGNVEDASLRGRVIGVHDEQRAVSADASFLRAVCQCHPLSDLSIWAHDYVRASAPLVLRKLTFSLQASHVAARIRWDGSRLLAAEASLNGDRPSTPYRRFERVGAETPPCSCVTRP